MAFRDLGNCTGAVISKSITKLDHFSSRQGIQERDKSVVQQRSYTVTITMDEITDQNLALALLGDLETNTAGDQEVALFTKDLIRCRIRVVGTNDVGHKIDWLLNLVEIGGEGEDVSLIGEDFTTLQIVGELLNDGTGYGTATFPGLGSAGAAITPDTDNYHIGKGIVSLELIA